MRIQLEPNLTEDQLISLYLHYKKEREKELIKATNNPLWNDIKLFVESNKSNILRNKQRFIVCKH